MTSLFGQPPDCWVTVYEGESLEIRPDQLAAVKAITEARRWTKPELAPVGRPLVDDDNEDSAAPRRPIEVVSAGEKPSIRFNDRFGIVHLPGLSIEVLPKVDRNTQHLRNGHMARLYEAYAGLPVVDRHAEHTGAAEQAPRGELTFLVLDAFVTQTEHLMRDALLRGYESRTEWLASPRGSIDVLETGGAYYSGRLEVLCEFEEFCDDTPLNRVIREALCRVMDDAHRLGLAGGRATRRVRPMLELMQEVGEMRPSDMEAEADRLTARYEPCLSLAKDVIEGFGRSPRLGTSHAVSFLFQSSTVAEVGIRSILARSLDGWRVSGRPIRSRSGEENYNPDLVFERRHDVLAVGDVKYKLIEERPVDWRRSMRGDLNQAIAFATAARVANSLVIGFWSGLGEPPTMDPATPGEVTVNYLTWDLNKTPQAASAELIAGVGDWLESVR